MKRFYLIFLLLPLTCFDQTPSTRQLTQQVWSLTEVMYHDVVNPPAAARFYAYSLLTGYEIHRQLTGNLARLPIRDELPAVNPPPEKRFIDHDFATLYGILEAGRLIIPSGFLLEDRQDSLIKFFISQGVSKRVIDV